MGNFMPTNRTNVLRLNGYDSCSFPVQRNKLHFISPSTLIDMHNGPDIPLQQPLLWAISHQNYSAMFFYHFGTSSG